jgi:hypothetical protein
MIDKFLKTNGSTRLPPGRAHGVSGWNIQSERTYDVQAGTMTITLPQGAEWSESISWEPISECARHYWIGHVWPLESNKRFRRAGAITDHPTEFDQNIGRYLQLLPILATSRPSIRTRISSAKPSSSAAAIF